MPSIHHLDPTPPVSCRYGAPRGRYTGPECLEPASGRITLRHVPLDSGGYDPGGAYWGHGQRLYYAADNDGNELFFRARDRDSAKRELRARFGEACRFYA